MHTPVKHVILGIGTNFRQNRLNGSEVMHKNTRAYNTLNGINIMQFYVYIPILEKTGPMDQFRRPNTNKSENRVSGVHIPAKRVILGIDTNFRENRWNSSEVLLTKPSRYIRR